METRVSLLQAWWLGPDFYVHSLNVGMGWLGEKGGEF